MNDPARHRKPFLLWSWTTLLVVLLSAAPTGGAPRTELVGSAFDPATVSVALNARQPKAKAASQAARRGLPNEYRSSPPVSATAAGERPAHSAFAGNGLRGTPFAGVLQTRALVGAHGPRAPPPA